ncbi:MAG: chromophore lyase CpcT/CpeT, partial [Bacteroidia bacterium]|nr:chromophore lyase CpcT/CpeT [Bacteroidia bacterium]
MMRKSGISLLVFQIFLLIQAEAQSPDLTRLTDWMAGSYSSEAQHLRDTANYFDIRLLMAPIWKERSDGHWFYVEQAVADYLDKPYRQRVYRIHEIEPGVFESVIYTLQEPLRFTHHPELLEKLPIDSLTEKKG